MAEDMAGLNLHWNDGRWEGLKFSYKIRLVLQM
jgi:hypothetical protein